MNNSVKTGTLLAAALLSFTSQGCKDNSQDQNQPNSSKPDHDNNAHLDTTTVQGSIAEDQTDQWSVQDYVSRYDAGAATPETKEVYKNDAGEQFIQMQVPTRTLQPEDTTSKDTSYTTVYKQLDGNKTQPVADASVQHSYVSSGVFVRWYPYYGSYYEGVGYSPSYTHQYSGYYTSMKEPVMSSGERASYHQSLMRTNSRSIVNLAKSQRSFRLNSRMFNSHVGESHMSSFRTGSRSGAVRGSFGRASFRGGGFGG